jgi:deoxycytidine triphosphate deaminase
MAVASVKRQILTSRLHDPTDPFSIQPVPQLDDIGKGSINLSVGTIFLAAERSSISSISASDPEQSSKMFAEVRIRPGQHYVMQPRQFVLASTFEYISLPNDLSGMIQSRSTYGRMGIIAATAAYVGPGYKGCPTLELVNVGEVAVEITPYDPICQLVVSTADEDNLTPSRYQCATRPVFARKARARLKNEDPRGAT